MRHEHTSYLRISGPGGVVETERDGLRCNHCQRAIIVQPDKGCDSPRMRLDRCGACHSTICRRCAKRLAEERKCAHFEKKLEAVERRYEFLKRAGVR